MIIQKIYIKSFGALINRTLEPSSRLTVLEGANECGKSTVAMFIKFMLYGLSAKATGYDSVSERSKYISWSTGVAAGEMTFESKGKSYRVERTLTQSVSASGREQFNEIVKVTDAETGDGIKLSQTPGEYFFGVSEKVFMQSAFVKSIDSARVDGASLKVALENLLSSGDGEINTKKALERLDSARKLLKHKNGLGGKIVDLSAEKRELEELLHKSQDVSKEIVDLEGTLADVSVKAARREEEASQLSALCHAYEAVRIGKRVKEIERCEGNITFLQSELGALDPSVDKMLLAKLDLCENTVRETERDILTLNEKKAELEAKCEGRDLSEPEDDETVMKKARKLKGAENFWLAVSCSFFAVSVIAAAAFLLLGSFLASALGKLFIPLIVITALFFSFAVAGVFVYRAKSKEYGRFLELWEVEDIYTLENAVLMKREKFRYTKKLLDNIQRIDSVLDEAIAKHDKEIDNGVAYAAIFGIENKDSIFDTLSPCRTAAEEVCSRRETMWAKLESEKGKLSALLEEVSEEERKGAEDREKEALESLDRQKILEMTKEQYAEAQREYSFASSQAKALRVREHDVEKRLAALRAAGESPAELAGKVSFIEGKIKELTFKHKALVAAYIALEAAGEKMRGDVIPEITEKASRIMSGVTEGKYSSLSSGEDLELSFNSTGEKRTVDFLSEGTKDAAYLSLRIALVQTMYGDDLPPMIFDDCFARLDEDRLSSLMSILSSDKVPQALVFTCRDLERKAAPEATCIHFN